MVATETPKRSLSSETLTLPSAESSSRTVARRSTWRMRARYPTDSARIAHERSLGLDSRACDPARHRPRRLQPRPRPAGRRPGPSSARSRRLVSSAELIDRRLAHRSPAAASPGSASTRAWSRAVGDDDLGRLQLNATRRRRGADTARSRSTPIEPTGISVVLAERGRSRDPHGARRDRGADGVRRRARGPRRCRPRPRQLALFLLSRPAPGTCRGSWEPPGAPGRPSRSTRTGTRRAPVGRASSRSPRQVDVLLPNLEEARRLSGADDAAGAAAALAERVPTVAIKLGAEGAIAVSGGETVTARAPAVDVVDTTGAGDSFNAGLIAGRLAGRAARPPRSRWRLRAGRCRPARPGGTAAQPTLAEAEAALASAMICVAREPVRGRHLQRRPAGAGRDPPADRLRAGRWWQGDERRPRGGAASEARPRSSRSRPSTARPGCGEELEREGVTFETLPSRAVLRTASRCSPPTTAR